MAQWKYKLNFSKFFHDDDFSIEQKGKLVAFSMRKTFPKSWLNWKHDNYDEELDNIIDAFDNITGFDDTSPVQEFDGWLEELYNWADDNHKCWITTV